MSIRTGHVAGDALSPTTHRPEWLEIAMTRRRTAENGGAPVPTPWLRHEHPTPAGSSLPETDRIEAFRSFEGPLPRSSGGPSPSGRGGIRPFRSVQCAIQPLERSIRLLWAHTRRPHDPSRIGHDGLRCGPDGRVKAGMHTLAVDVFRFAEGTARPGARTSVQHVPSRPSTTAAELERCDSRDRHGRWAVPGRAVSI